MGEIHVGLFCKKFLNSLPCQRISGIGLDTADLAAFAADRQDAVQRILHFRQQPGLNAYPDEHEDRPKEKYETYERFTEK